LANFVVTELSGAFIFVILYPYDLLHFFLWCNRF